MKKIKRELKEYFKLHCYFSNVHNFMYVSWDLPHHACFHSYKWILDEVHMPLFEKCGPYIHIHSTNKRKHNTI